jgi:hypothetical protein
MLDVIPYWMWAASLLVLALVCGAALNPQASRRPRARPPEVADALNSNGGLM